MTITTDDSPPVKQAGNEIIGERVHTLMWRTGRTQKGLGELLGVDQGSVSKRLRGKISWTALEVIATALWLGVPVTDLMPELEISPTDPDSPSGAPSRARTYDLRIKSP